MIYIYLFPGIRFSGVTLALVSHINPESIDRYVQSLSTTITSGSGDSN